MRVLAEQHNRSKEAERLKTVVNEIVEPEAFDPSVINLEFINGSLVFTLDTIFTEDWFQTLKNGHYNHSWNLGYDTHSLKKVSKNQFSMPIRGTESPESVKQIVGNVKDWVITVSREYSAEAKRRAIAEQRRKEEARLAEIKKLEKENEMNATLNAVLKDLL